MVDFSSPSRMCCDGTSCTMVKVCSPFNCCRLTGLQCRRRLQGQFSSPSGDLSAPSAGATKRSFCIRPLPLDYPFPSVGALRRSSSQRACSRQINGALEFPSTIVLSIRRAISASPARLPGRWISSITELQVLSVPFRLTRERAKSSLIKHGHPGLAMPYHDRPFSFCSSPPDGTTAH